MSEPYFGFLNINKPSGPTSRRVVDRVVQVIAPCKAGHAGTLDPLASGVLIVAVGKATRLISHVQQQKKQYRGTFVLGQESDTDDITGDVQFTKTDPFERKQLESILPKFLGRIQQVPPRYSAVHVNGHRAYRLARKGETPELQPREIEVFRIELTRFEFPEFELEIECGSGTYVRSIGRDMGRLLGCGAVMTELVRTQVGQFDLKSALDLADLDTRTVSEKLHPAIRAVGHLPCFDCDASELHQLRHGQMIRTRRFQDWARSRRLNDETVICLQTQDRQIAAIGRFRSDDRSVAPNQVFLQ